MKSTDITREELWAQQNLSAMEIDYSIWERERSVTLARLLSMYINVNTPLPLPILLIY